jgi:hypothetical protein
LAIQQHESNIAQQFTIERHATLVPEIKCTRK